MMSKSAFDTNFDKKVLVWSRNIMTFHYLDDMFVHPILKENLGYDNCNVFGPYDLCMMAYILLVQKICNHDNCALCKDGILDNTNMVSCIVWCVDIFGKS